ncbi:MAG TPA: efflux transporter outer membrane subunit [Acidiphilium sp.]|nr:MAG: RND transporter [Acidiphilium sp. 21-60-14]OYV90906.1 MAG: RND transporter [Acidiphilium sp. 37-60-79]OZB39622.1 MAG: RND transporter [Acidiphilium sp. 34-60-192]HQT88287.1 efflux transporter outer membrane subunit [Acidiphilium sp.]HQU23336.1 efflux transporter outer membrane subunit [Acidiphilium sp.]
MRFNGRTGRQAARIVAFGILNLGMMGGLAGCELGPNFNAPHPHVPASFKAADAPAQDRNQISNAAIDTAWWQSFHDPVLTALEHDAVSQNLDVQIATQRLAEARAQAEIEGASLYPSLDFAGSLTREGPSKKGVFTALGGGSNTATSTRASNTAGGARTSIGGGGIPGSAIQPFNLFQYGFSSVFDFDLWGKNRRTREAALAAVTASADARRAVLLNIEAEVAQDYISLRADQTLLNIAQSNLRTADRLTKLTHERAQAGLANALEVADSEAQAASVKAQIPSLRAAIAGQESQIGLLLGRSPGALATELGAPRAVPAAPPVVPVGLPSQLLTRRPDMREAVAKLHEATAEIGVATADFFPDLTLSGSVSLQALQFSNLNQLAAVTYAIGPEITVPLFEGGKLRGQLRLRKAEQREAAVNYAKTVLTALHQVDDTLTDYDQEQHRLVSLNREVAASQHALTLAQERYRQGLADYLEVLTAQQTVLGAEQTQAQSLAAISMDLVKLYQALGGGWEQTYPIMIAAKAN